MRQHDTSYDNIPPSGGSVASPVGSQISNMSNPNKFIKMLGGRDRGRKAKALKVYMHIVFTFLPFPKIIHLHTALCCTKSELAF